MKKTLSLLLVLLCALLLPMQAAAAVAQSESFYVNDAASVLSPETEERILAINEKLVSDCHQAQLVVVTVPYTDGLYADEYAYQLFNDWGVGSDTENNGMLLLFATKENRGWLAVGSGIADTFSDEMAGHYLDQYFWDAYDAQKYDEGVTALCNALYNWYRVYYGVTPGGMTSLPAPPVYNETATVGTGTDFGVILILLLLLLLLSARRTRRAWGHWGIWPFYYFSPWWSVRTRRYYTPPVWRSHYRSPSNPGYRPPSSGYRPPSSGFGGHSGGGFGRGGSGFGGGGFGGRSGGGGGRR